MKKDISKDFGPIQAIAPAALATDNTPAAIDMNNFDAAIVCIHVGVGGITFDGTNKIEFKLTHSDDNSSYAAVTSDDVAGVTVATGGIVKSLTAAHAAASLTSFGYHGGKRYLKLLADFSGTHGTGTPISAIVLRGEPRLCPVA
jgi:hypothetical protein